jgi:hypothetical protein
MAWLDLNKQPESLGCCMIQAWLVFVCFVHHIGSLDYV